MGGLSKVHMPSSARAGTLAANNPQDSRAAREREDATLLILFGLPFCSLCKTKKNCGFFLFSTRCPARKRMHYAERTFAVARPRDTSYKREAQLRFSTRVRSPGELESLTTLIHDFLSVGLGKPGHIVSPLVIEIAIQEDGWKQAEFEWRAGSEPLDDLPRALIFLVGIEAHEVKVQLIGVDLGEEVSPASKVF